MNVQVLPSLRHRKSVHAGALLALGVLLASCSILPHVQSQTKTAATGVDPHRLAAELVAATLLASFTPPPGSVSLSSAPNGSSVSVPPSSQATSDLIDVTRLWRSHGDMVSVLAWARRHRASNWVVVGTGDAARFSVIEERDLTFFVPTLGSAIQSSQVLVSDAPSGPNDVTLRVDVQEVWIPTRPGWSYVPRTVGSVTATIWTGASERPRSKTSTEPQTIAWFRRLVNAAPESTVTETSCPAFLGDRFALTFESHDQSGYVVSGFTGECGGISLNAVGLGRVALTDTGGRIIAAIEALAGAK